MSADLEVLKVMGIRPIWVNDLDVEAILLLKRGLVLIDAGLRDEQVQGIIEEIETRVMADAS